MKTIVKVAVFLLGIFVLCGCPRPDSRELKSSENNTNSGNKGLFVFDFEKSVDAKSVDTFLLNDITKSVKFVPLESKKESFFGNFSYRFSVFDGNFFISGDINKRGIFKFDSLGRFVEEIIKIGRGPGEVILYSSWSINDSLGKLFVPTERKMVVKSLRTNDRKDILYPKEYSSLLTVPLNDGTYVLARKAGTKDVSEPYLIFLDGNGSVVNTVHYSEKRNRYYEMREDGSNDWRPFETHRLSPNYTGNVLFHDVFNDTLYCIKNSKGIHPYAILSRGNKIPNVADVYDMSEKNRQVHFYGFADTEKYFLFKYYYGGKIHTDIRDKASGQTISHVETNKNGHQRRYNFSGMYKLPDSSIIPVNIVYVGKDKIYCLIEGSTATKFMSNVNEFDNPVIMVLELK